MVACRCKFEHPPKERLPVVQMNSVGLPIRHGQWAYLPALLSLHCSAPAALSCANSQAYPRPFRPPKLAPSKPMCGPCPSIALLAAGEPDCRFYVQNGRCGFGMSCRFHHSEPVPGGMATPLAQALMQQQLHQHQLHQHQLHMQQQQPSLGMQPMASGLQQLQVGSALGMALPAGMPMAGLGLPMSNSMGLAVAGMQGVPSFAMHSPVAGVSCLPGSAATVLPAAARRPLSACHPHALCWSQGAVMRCALLLLVSLCRTPEPAPLSRWLP